MNLITTLFVLFIYTFDFSSLQTCFRSNFPKVANAIGEDASPKDLEYMAFDFSFLYPPSLLEIMILAGRYNN